MDVLTGDVDLVAIVRRNMERRVPQEPVLQVGRWTVGVLGPHLDVAHLPPALVVADHDATHAAGAGGGGPDDVRIDRIGRREAALTSADRVPHAARNADAAAATTAPATLAETAVARPAVRRPILLVRVNIVRDLIVNGHVIELGVCKPLLQPGASARL